MKTNTRSWPRGACAWESAVGYATKRKPVVLRISPALGAAKPWPNHSLNRTPCGMPPMASISFWAMGVTPQVAG
jgi:hypothetical protein